MICLKKKKKTNLAGGAALMSKIFNYLKDFPIKQGFDIFSLSSDAFLLLHKNGKS